MKICEIFHKIVRKHFSKIQDSCPYHNGTVFDEGTLMTCLIWRDIEQAMTERQQICFCPLMDDEEIMGNDENCTYGIDIISYNDYCPVFQEYVDNANNITVDGRDSYDYR